VQIVKKYGWKGLSLGVGSLAALATQRLLEVLWRALRGSTPPKVAADRSAPFVDALSWAIATGVGAGVARLLAIRTAAAVWESAAHEPPPEPALVEQTSAA
jgi:hypothetical protein